MMLAWKAVTPLKSSLFPEECKMERATSEREAERLGSGQSDPDKREVNEVHMDVLIKLPAAGENLEGKSTKEPIIGR